MAGRHGVNLIGQIFDRLKVTYQYTDKDTNKEMVLCTCKCGNTVELERKQLFGSKRKSCLSCYEKMNDLENAGKSLEMSEKAFYKSYKVNATRRGIKFELTDDEFNRLIHAPCSYCGKIDVKIINNNKQMICNGIDRLNGDGDYEIDNCVPCCTRCNRAKSTMTEKEFMAMVREIYSYRQLGKE